MAAVEIPEWINRRTVEEAYRSANRAMVSRRESMASTWMRAALARDARLLKALEGGAKILQKMSEEQFGVSGLDVGGIRVQATEFQLWEKAYRAVDEGWDRKSMAIFQWIFAAAAVLCGYA